MNRIVKGTLLILLGFLMLAWFIYSLADPPRRPSETYAMDWALIPIRLIGAIAGFAGGILAFRGK
jgi:uncharacterized membrane protein YfcA